MTADSPVAALRVANEAFLVSSMIERCPKTMMLRELVVNAIEAAAAAEGGKTVEIMAREVDGARKLCIRNTGRGLSAEELDRICDLASSINKINSLDANFGMGAKVASLPSNKHGLRYRSCKDGVASEVILGQRDGIYGRLRRTGPDGIQRDVIDATVACRTDGYDLGHDWTEVVLFGNAPAQDTVADPYGGNPKSDAGWLTRDLLLRFFRVPADVSVLLSGDVLGSGAGGGGPATRVRTLAEPGTAERQEESVRTASGVAIHYRYDPPDASTPVAIPGIGCIVFKDEIYDPRTARVWQLDAPSYGVTFGARHVSVFVELPADYLVRPEAYRQFLRFRGGDQRQVFLMDFAPLVAAHLPAWLRTVIRSFGPQQAAFADDVADELRGLLEDLDIAPAFVPPRPPGEPRPPVPPPTVRPNLMRRQPEPPKVPPPKRFERPPEIIGLDDAEMLAERGLKGRAARFYPAAHQLFVNLTYPAVDSIAAGLLAEFHGTGEVETLRATARSVAGWAVTRRIARALVYSLSKKAAGWSAEDVARAQSPESFSLVADDWAGVMDLARTRMTEQVGAPMLDGPVADAPTPEMAPPAAILHPPQAATVRDRAA